MLNSLYALLVIFLLFLSSVLFYMEFLSVKKHFPNMDFLEYVMISEKIRITPHEK